MTAPRVDAHHHFWDVDVTPYPWMTERYAAIRRNFGPADLSDDLARQQIDGTVLVQTRSSVEETRQFLRVAASTSYVWGVVGWVDLTSRDVGDVLGALRRQSDDGRFLVGIRHQVHDESDPDWLQRDDVRRGLGILAEQGMTFDLLVRPRELAAAIDTVRAIPDLGFVVDHIAKPAIRDGAWEPWAGAIAELALEPNVTCKLSGLVTEADWQGWNPDDLRPYVDHCLAAFGPDRVMFGSDWPVCLLAGSYAAVSAAVVDLLPAEPSVSSRVFGANAMRVYGLQARPFTGSSMSQLSGSPG
jgi:L-fuconolactonase